jgi:hypothetical protein
LTNFEVDKFTDNFKFDKVIYNIEDVSGFITLLNFVELFYGLDKLNEPGYKSKFYAIFLKQLTERTTDLIEATNLDDGANDYQHHVQLELLKKFFHFNEVPYVGDLKYYVGEDKFSTYLETACSENDLMVFAINKEDDLDMRLLQKILDTRDEIIPEFGILIKTSDSKISSLTFKFSSHSSSNQLIVFLVSLFITNNSSLTQAKVFIDKTNEEEIQITNRLLERLHTKIKIEITEIDTIDEVQGLFITRFDNDTLSELIGKSHQEDGFDIFAVK